MSRAVAILRPDPETGPYSVLGGVCALAVAAVSAWLSGGVLSVTGAALGGLVAGYLAGRIGSPSGPVGFRAGLIGWLPALLVATEPLRTADGADAGGRVIALGVAAVTTAVLLAVGGFIGAFAARLGGWLAERGGYPAD
ncbi:DUF5518 domain-containing protein [Halomicroarcula sp. F28]|uniref:DUF5518 domain-containing protein n=1 Tax=Haloarcula salinisoli TaxID=2487746 RepID=UPI001C730400|nr:DUF5518 domain-containing protein [Halomicroarcula salinisoli]MBX0286437.1 DUF5518 domain-containing protein [Halomicroarcula salinisoli]